MVYVKIGSEMRIVNNLLDFSSIMTCTQILMMAFLMGVQILGQDISSDTKLPEGSNDSHEALNDLGYRLMMKALEHRNVTNIAISPVGVTVLLAMALLGSTGTTYEEIADILGFSRDILKNRQHHEDLGILLQNLNDTTAKTILADAVFVDQRSRLRDMYKTYLDRVYRGEVMSVDFQDGNVAKQTINEWVRAHTEDKIEEFLDKTLPSTTKVVLLNALYFKGHWARPFRPELTNKMVFRGASRKVVTDFMLNFGKFNYISSKEHDLHMVALPYNDNVTTLYALKPKDPKRTSLLQLLETLDYMQIHKLISKMTKQKCIVRFPKMNISSSLNLEEYVKLVGAPSMFDAEKANFALMVEVFNKDENKSEIDVLSRMGSDDRESMEYKELIDRLPNPGIHIDSIIQKVKINIDEHGTEATSATAGIMSRTAELFYADSPFFMFIRNERTRLVTFSAVIYDPTQT
ncbi:serine protease inhibitor 28Dc [Amyelois transitella]|uniref:serine protease inhibitor 28Dc n=1 Tax=Amyelois transitella TaxID=680683 RepID=UPI00067DB4FE|nr:serine protease inhibitor 28Dc [Amyelois transitella]